jgi:hypothetical protein
VETKPGLSVAGSQGMAKGAYMNNQSEPKNSQEFDAYFEDNDISMLLDTKQKRVNIDLPANIVQMLDYRAQISGLTRQALVKYWISEKLGIIN